MTYKQTWNCKVIQVGLLIQLNSANGLNVFELTLSSCKDKRNLSAKFWVMWLIFRLESKIISYKTTNKYKTVPYLFFFLFLASLVSCNFSMNL